MASNTAQAAQGGSGAGGGVRGSGIGSGSGSGSGSNTSVGGCRYAFVTLLTTDEYLPGALVLAHSLRRAHNVALQLPGTLTPTDIANLGAGGLSASPSQTSSSSVELVCLVTPSTVSVRSIRALVRAFDKVVGVEPLSFSGLAATSVRGQRDRSRAREIRENSQRKLALLGRPDLDGKTLTKLHAWRLTGYDKVVFLDADMLILRPIAHLFSLTASLSASPDIGWPDAFNSGLLVLTPSLATFADMRAYAVERGSWDGADQGFLNDYYGGELATGDESRGGGWHRLPFRYNVTPNAGYMFAPAYERYGPGIMAAHFIGQHKPWNRPSPSRYSSSAASRARVADYDALLARWHDAYEEYYPAIAAARSGGTADVVFTERGAEVVERPFVVPTYRAVWDAETGIEHRRPHPRTRGVRNRTHSSAMRAAGQVEDLKKMFSPDVVAASAAADVDLHVPGEGIYISLPLDGRTSLMPLDLGSEDSGDEGDSAATTPRQSMSSASRSGQSVPYGHEFHREGVPPTSIDIPASATQAHSNEVHDWSPPKVSWDPAKEPPPTGQGSSEYQMRNPPDTFYVNAWDVPAHEQPQGKAALFPAQSFTGTSLMSESSRQRALAKLQREHFFDNLGSERPDPSRVKAVFPWEEGHTQQQKPTSSSSTHQRDRGQPKPRRMFPDEDPPSVVPGSVGLNASLERGSGSPSYEVEEPSLDYQTALHPSYGPPTSLNKALPANLSYANAWDQVKGINDYVRRVKGLASSSSKAGTVEGQGTAPQGASSKHRSSTFDGGFGRGVGSPGGLATDDGGRGEQNSADQSGDGDDESSSDDDDGDDDEGGESWPREKPGKGYQKRVESSKSGETFVWPKSPRQHGSPALYGGGGSGGGSASGGFGSGGAAGGSSAAMYMARSRSSSGAGSSSHLGSSSRHYSRAEQPADYDAILASSPRRLHYNGLYGSSPGSGVGAGSSHFIQQQQQRIPSGTSDGGNIMRPGSGSSSPTAIIGGNDTTFTRSELAQMARAHAHAQGSTSHLSSSGSGGHPSRRSRRGPYY